MTALELLSQPLWLRVATALLHFLWQGAMIAGLLWLVLSLVPVRSPRRRYALTLAALLILAAAPVATFFLVGEPARSEIAAAKPSSRVEFDTDSTPVAPPFESSGANSPTGRGEGDARSARAGRPAPRVAPGLAERVRHTAEPPPNDWRDRWSAAIVNARPWLLLAWMLGVFALSLRLLLGWIGLARMTRRRSPVARELIEAAERLCRRIGLRRFPRILACPRSREALAIGLFRPIVVLPTAWLTNLPPAVVEAVVAHELAHIRRWDLWVNLFQRLGETVLFYHPAVWWVSRRLRAERELCCDDLAVAATGERVAYAEALEQIARIRLNESSPLLATGIGGRKMALLNRVRHVLGMTDGSRRLGWWPAGLLALLVPAALWMTSTMWSAALADDDREERRRDRPRAEREEGERARGERRSPEARERDERSLREIREQLDDVQKGGFKVADGEIRHVDPSRGLVWINLGSADELRPRTTFSVYTRDKKGAGHRAEDIVGSIEVTEITGPHTAKARILERNVFKLISPGSPIYTPVWTAARRQRLAPEAREREGRERRSPEARERERDERPSPEARERERGERERDEQRESEGLERGEARERERDRPSPDARERERDERPSPEARERERGERERDERRSLHEGEVVRVHPGVKVGPDGKSIQIEIRTIRREGQPDRQEVVELVPADSLRDTVNRELLQAIRELREEVQSLRREVQELRERSGPGVRPPRPPFRPDRPDRPGFRPDRPDAPKAGAVDRPRDREGNVRRPGDRPIEGKLPPDVRRDPAADRPVDRTRDGDAGRRDEPRPDQPRENREGDPPRP